MIKRWAGITAFASLAALCIQGHAFAAAPPTLSTGSRGADVALMQQLLTYGGDPVAITALIGPTTEGLVKDFQRRHNLAVDGVVGTTTWHTLQPVLRLGDSGAAVAGLQAELNAKRGAGLPSTGYFGDQTRAAVLEFQQHEGLAEDGVVGHATWDALIAHFTDVGESGPGYYRCPDAEGTWGTGNTIATVQFVASEWAAEGHSVRLGINDISLPHGGYFPPHDSHRNGTDVDFRLLRNDGKELPVGDYHDAVYSRALTQHLVDLLLQTGEVEFILFNDPQVHGVKPWDGHENHLHVHFRQ